MNENQIVYLVSAPLDANSSSIANHACFPALGVLALGTWLKNRIPEVEVIVRDGSVYSQDKILKDIEKYQPAVTCVSVLGSTYQNALEIARTAKLNGSTTIFGNDHAAQLADKIIKRPFVDYIVSSEYGEESLESLVRRQFGENISLDEIPHLVWFEETVKGFDYVRDRSDLSIMNSKLSKSKTRRNVLDVFPITDRTLYPEQHWKTYLRNYLKKFGKLHRTEITGVTTINRARGCSRANNKCKFCDMYLEPVSSSPERFWEEVKMANLQVGANVFYEA
jgi:hypothetical protein